MSESASFRLATWNLERPKLQGWARNPLIIDKIKNINAGLWILTETNAAVCPGDDYFSAATLPLANYHQLGENFTTIWTQWPMLRRIKTFDPDLAICVEVKSPLGLMMVYGTIITYANDKGKRQTSKRWVEHRKSIREHSKDWQHIRQAYPDHHFVVAGDFNQSRDGSGWYEDAEALQLLTEALRASQLVCVTENKKLVESRSTIDHICLSSGLVAEVSGWEGTAADGQRMSDHNGVEAVLSTKQLQST